MSRITCLISFSGFSALSIRSFKLARIKVDTRSINDITRLQFYFLPSGRARPEKSWTPYSRRHQNSSNYNSKEQPSQSPDVTAEITNGDTDNQPKSQPAAKPELHRCSPFRNFASAEPRCINAAPSTIPTATPTTSHAKE